jgi:hypothetical protein
VIYNDGGAWGGTTGFEFNKATSELSVPGSQTKFVVSEGTPITASGKNILSFNSATHHPAYSYNNGSARDLVLLVAPPAHNNSTCIAGDFSADTSYFYYCTATNTWKRTALAADSW